MAKINLETLDEYANKAEDTLAIGSLGSMAATAAFPNPVTAGTSLAMNIGSGVIDVYQLARALYNKDYKSAAINGTELLMSIIGAKAFKKAKDVSKHIGNNKVVTVGRNPKNKRTVTIPITKADTYPYIIGGTAAGTYSDVSSLGGTQAYLDYVKEQKRQLRSLENGGK